MVLVLPLTVHFIERNLEVYLFIMGFFAVTSSHFCCEGAGWSLHLVEESLIEPLMITAAVLLFGFMVYMFREKITRSIVWIEHKVGSKVFCFFLVTLLGIFSSVITAIISAIILVEVINALKFPKEFEKRLVIFGCFSIGLGAALTPIGEPLSTIAVAKLKGVPYHADFFFLLKHLGVFIVPGVLGIGVLAALLQPSVKEGKTLGLSENEKETIKDVFMRALKVYVFIMALIFLGHGFKPIIDTYIIKLPGLVLYWINTISAVLDNATLAAAEISPAMSLNQMQMTLMGLLISGGMLIPGNIPNIIAAGKLGITSKDWARIGLPFGFSLMMIYFTIFLFL
ncbi:MAG: DUF1646 family protein [Endomicrobiales bacterium]|nr:DUF1646 family protein [Endomicrobiales bacterium]